MEAFLKDFTHSLRAFTRSPAFTLAAVAALTLGIGANTAIFSVVNAVLLRPVAYPDPERIVLFMNVSPQGAGPAASPAKFMHWRSQDSVVQDGAAFATGVLNYTGGSSPEQFRSARVSSDFFKLFGATFVQGRNFLAEEDRPNVAKSVVLSRGTWETRFASDPQIVGKAISLGGEPYTVVGVLGDFDFADFGPAPQVFTLFQFDPNTTDQGNYFQSGARLKPGVTLEQAKARFQIATEEFKRKYPNALGPNQSFTVEPMKTVLVRNVRTSLFVLIGAVSFVLLIACANVANLLMVRATGRRREIAMRAALGGSRQRIVRQLLTESLMLSIVGGALGLALGILGIRALLSVNTAGLPRVGVDGTLVGLDWRVLAYTVAVALGTGIVFGLFPAFQSARADLTAVLKEGGGRTGSGFRQNKARSILVVTEVALALVLLVGSALLIRTSVALANVDPGFDAHNVLTMQMSLAGEKYATSESADRAIRDGVERLNTLPGVELASATCCVPLQGGFGLGFTIIGRPLPPDAPVHGGGQWKTVSPGYFEVFKIPVKRGRTFTERDTSAGPGVVIINEAMARQFWPDGDPLSTQLTIGRGGMREFALEVDRQIIGVVGDTRDGGLNNVPGPAMYIPQAQVPDAANALNLRIAPMSWVVRTAGEPMALSSQIQEQLRQATGLPVTNIRSMEEVVSRSTSRQRFNMWLMAVFGGCALLLAAIGIYGLMAYSVEQRTQEIGIRLALGASAAQVKNMVVVQGVRLALVGVVIGLAAAVGLAQLLQTLLFGVTVRDPLTFVGVPMLLTIVAVLAVWLPARRASSVDPMVALRYE
jgi:putative ABC transport system permease protein